MRKKYKSLKTQLLLGFLFAVQLALVYSTRNATSRYNVVLVIFDDMRPVIGGYGDRLAYTPHLDAFMNESYYFTRAYSQQALCAPSRNSMLTSRRPDTLHLYDFYSYWRNFVGNFTTLPQYFKEHGYYTYSTGKIFHPGISSNNTDDYPLSWTARPFRPKTEKYMNSPVCPDVSGVLKKNLICPVHLQTQPYKTLPDIESTTEAIRFVQTRTKNRKPYFLALGFHKPHINFRFPKQFLNHFRIRNFYNYTEDTIKPHDMPNVAWNPYTDVRSRDDFKYMNISFPYGPISRLQSAQIRQAYYASVAYVDDLFGKFMANIDKNNTIVLVTSDHGWSLGEHAEWAKYSNFEVALRVPLIIRTPEYALDTAKRVNTMTELVDVFPTLVDLAHLPSLPRCTDTTQLACTEGKSLFPQLGGVGLGEEHVALSQYPRPGTQPTKHPNSDKPKLKNIKVMGYSMRTENYRYTLWVRFHAQNFSRDWTDIYGEEMYDHRLDAGEEMNLAELPEFDDVRTWLRKKLIVSFSK
ncbi:iduronate 2-sulfatase-like [Teleopsis dalmanni]|uniref:iduronate 2-sulfatase-like n=1 Tax=Teleopsis dalmanni TaxID=139649 RepID=UPI0018CD5433|nr:iduronate 2-sulfatase-like [Teleopsis dalmanni]XP_037940683.1 iduronate 2-sulfatase-like [Teleopsis dalmanni]